MRTFILLPVALALIVITAFATPSYASDNAKKFVQDISTEVLGLLKSDTTSDKEKADKLINLFEAYVDTKWMGKFVLGQYYRTAEPAQLERYFSLYHHYLIHSYVPKFREYAGESFEVLRITDKGEGQFIVQTKLALADSSQDIRVDYRLREENGTFKIIDIKGEGISLITTQRSDFGGLISRKGLDYFMDKLQGKVDALKQANADL